ncbi:helix-turn-helix transcriptional regulator [Mesobacillus harenae]|uniref:helix-turn-helix domain-containing protein n=1 Tax=Mesobacillus harenae TaxID=2213203 RepID=UPI0030D505BA
MSNREPIHIGTVLEKLRRMKQLSQEELAQRTSLSLSYISLLERNHHEPGLGSLYDLATALEMDFLDFMKEIDDHYKNG